MSKLIVIQILNHHERNSSNSLMLEAKAELNFTISMCERADTSAPSFDFEIENSYKKADRKISIAVTLSDNAIHLERRTTTKTRVMFTGAARRLPVQHVR
jgi:hypothetical protein